MTAAAWILGVLATLAVIACGVTGHVGDWYFGAPTGWWLIGHMAAAPVMMVTLTVSAVLWGRAHRFDRRRERGESTMGSPRKLWFWLLMISAFVSMTTMLAAMMPLFGYTGQDAMTVAHEISGIGVMAAGGLYLLSAAFQKR